MHEVHSIVPSKLFQRNVVIKIVFWGGMWKSQSTFSAFYHKDISHKSLDIFSMQSFVVAQQVIELTRDSISYLVYECFHHKFVVKCKLWVERPPSLSGGIGYLNNQGHRIPVAVSSDAADLYLGRTSSLGYRSKVHTLLIIDLFAISRNGKPQFMYHGFLIPWLGMRLHSSTRTWDHLEVRVFPLCVTHWVIR